MHEKILGSPRRRLAGAVLTVFLCGSLYMHPLQAATELDQQQELITHSVGVPGGFRQAQTFVAGRTGRLRQVAVHVTNPLGPVELRVQLQTVSEGRPTGQVLAEQLVSLTAPSAAGWVTVSFDAPAPVAAGVPYALVLAPSANFGWSTATTDPYKAGQAWTSGGEDWWTEKGDYVFRTFVSSGNSAPVLEPVTVPDSLPWGEALAFTAVAADPDPGDQLRFSLEGGPAGAVIDAATGWFRWDPTAGQVGTHRFTVRVSDGALSAEQQVTVTVARRTGSLTYTGDSFREAGPGAAGAQVELRALLSQAPDAPPADPTLARVRFELYAAGSTGAPDLVVGDLPVDQNGEVVTTLLVPVGTWTVRVALEPSNPYWTASPAGEGSLTVAEPNEPAQGIPGRVTGGGWLVDGDSRGHFAFAVGALKSGKVKGQAHYSFVGADGYRYRVRTLPGATLDLQIEPGGGQAAFTAGCTLQRLDPASGQVLETRNGYSLAVRVTDQTNRLVLTVRDGSGAVWHEAGGALGGGQVQVHAR